MARILDNSYNEQTWMEEGIVHEVKGYREIWEWVWILPE